MHLLRLEQQRAEIIAVLNENLSVRKRIFLLSEFIFTLSEFETVQIRETYFKEFYPYFISLISSYEPFGVHPDLTKKVIEAAQVLFDYSKRSEDSDELVKQINRLSHQHKILIDVLNNTSTDEFQENYLFPVLEEDHSEENKYGLVDSISVTISKLDKLTFTIVPSEKHIETRIKQQVETSWETALVYLNRFKIKSKGNEQVVIHLNKRLGNYRGDSLGTVLSLAFIRAILLYYNSSVEINVKAGVAFTGKMDKEGIIYPVKDEVIRNKIETIFFSPINVFSIPHTDLKQAEKKLNELQIDFPKRVLNIIGVKTLDDVINRRDVADLKKRKLILRGAKLIRSNWISVLALLLTLLISLYVIYFDLDTNPSFITFDKNIMHINNKSGKVLWSKRLLNEWVNKPYRDQLVKIIDIDNDGFNEVIVSAEVANDPKLPNKYGRVVCMKSENEIIWEYIFRDTISTSSQHTNRYFSRIIGIDDDNLERILYIIAENKPLYPNAIYQLNAATGERVGSTFWHAGIIVTALISDFNSDGDPEIVGSAVNNGYETSAIFSIDINNLDGQGPAPPAYKFKNLNPAKLNNYILLPKSELNNYYNKRYNFPHAPDCNFSEMVSEFQFGINEGGARGSRGKIMYIFDEKLELKLIDFNDRFQRMRDSLVTKDKLEPPFTNTLEYRELLKQQIRYWNGEMFVKKEDLR